MRINLPKAQENTHVCLHSVVIGARHGAMRQSHLRIVVHVEVRVHAIRVGRHLRRHPPVLGQLGHIGHHRLHRRREVAVVLGSQHVQHLVQCLLVLDGRLHQLLPAKLMDKERIIRQIVCSSRKLPSALGKQL